MVAVSIFKMKRKYLVIILVAALLLGAAFYLTAILSYKIKLNQLDAEILRLLKNYSISKTDVTIVKEYTVKKPLDIERFRDRLKKLIERSGLQLLRYETKYERDRAYSIFEIGVENRTFYILKLISIRPFRKPTIVPKRPTAKVAIVIDDWGYNMNSIELLDSINIPLTISILPNLAFSTRIDRSQKQKKNREIILHMPMEPKAQTIRLEENTLLTSMGKDEILTLLRNSLKTVPYAKGISNHMGSKATQDKELVRTVMKELKQKRLYFLDSLATPDTVCQQEAKGLKLSFAKRDIFLDNIADKGNIFLQMDKLIRLAKRRGFAVGVGHDRTLTLQVIKDKAEELKDTDVEFVFVSELAK